MVFLQFFIEKTSPWRYTWPPWALQMAPLGVTDGPRVAQKSGRLALENMIAGFISLVKIAFWGGESKWGPGAWGAQVPKRV